MAGLLSFQNRASSSLNPHSWAKNAGRRPPGSAAPIRNTSRRLKTIGFHRSLAQFGADIGGPPWVLHSRNGGPRLLAEPLVTSSRSRGRDQTILQLRPSIWTGRHRAYLSDDVQLQLLLAGAIAVTTSSLAATGPVLRCYWTYPSDRNCRRVCSSSGTTIELRRFRSASA